MNSFYRRLYSDISGAEDLASSDTLDAIATPATPTSPVVGRAPRKLIAPDDIVVLVGAK